jgi:23S rRNA (adenine2503-C2)-methyltransferase
MDSKFKNKQLVSIHDTKGIEDLFIRLGEPKYRLKQFFQSIYKDIVYDISEMTTFSKNLRDCLEEEVEFCSLNQLMAQESAKDRTIKFLFQTNDNKKIEAVLMRHLKGRNTLCISCQVGCAMGCKFCATGKLGLTRDLTYSEILDQIMLINRHLKDSKQKITNIVFMGMGEPLLNIKNVFPAIKIMCQEDKLDLSNRHVTVSTCGIITGIEKLLKEEIKVNLAISIHSADQTVRDELMPINKTFPLGKLMIVLDEYVEFTNRRVFYEYILIDGITDTEKMAKKLGHLLRDRLAHVNLIPYNTANNKDIFQPSSKTDIYKFKEILTSYGVTNSVRFTLGEDIDAACGQLAAKESEE